MELKKLIARRIERKLGFTNGWSVEPEKYTMMCEELADEILMEKRFAIQKGDES